MHPNPAVPAAPSKSMLFDAVSCRFVAAKRKKERRKERVSALDRRRLCIINHSCRRQFVLLTSLPPSLPRIRDSRLWFMLVCTRKGGGARGGHYFPLYSSFLFWVGQCNVFHFSECVARRRRHPRCPCNLVPVCTGCSISCPRWVPLPAQFYLSI